MPREGRPLAELDAGDITLVVGAEREGLPEEIVALSNKVATIALPVLMVKRAAPLIPPHLFRSRNFTVTNISTFLIYGALYVLGYFITLFVQGTVGFTAAAAGMLLLLSRKRTHASPSG